MKCPFCHARVARRPERCPECGFALRDSAGTEPPVTLDNSARGRRLRLILIIGAGLAVAVGIFARMPGSADTSKGKRLRARGFVGNALEALAEGDFGDAREQAALALAEDDLFAEAYLVRGMADLALGDFQAAQQHAREGAKLLDDGRIDSRAWGELPAARSQEAGRAIADRIGCVANAAAAGELQAGEPAIVYRMFHALVEAETCDQAQLVLRQWSSHRRPSRVIAAALRTCPESFRCLP